MFDRRIEEQNWLEEEEQYDNEKRGVDYSDPRVHNPRYAAYFAYSNGLSRREYFTSECLAERQRMYNIAAAQEGSRLWNLPSAQEDSRRARAERLPELERGGHSFDTAVPQPQGVPQDPLGHYGPGPDRQAAASRTSGQAKRARESPEPVSDHGAKRTKSATFERRFNHLYRPDPSLPDVRIWFRKHSGKLVSELMEGGREIEWLRFMQSDKFKPTPALKELMEAIKAHSEAFDQFMHTCEPALVVERQ